MGNGMDRSTSGGNGGRRRDMIPPPDEEFEFLPTFQRQYGTNHPFFYSFRLEEALSIADEERKFVFMCIHSPNHPFSSSFCKDTLCCEPVVQFLEENFISWGALFDRGQSLQIASYILRPATFPCCSVVAPAAADNINVLQQMEGPMSPQQLLEMLERAVDEHGLAFGHLGLKRGDGGKLELWRPMRRLELNRIQLNYHATLVTDQIVIRFRNGERREQNFSSSGKVQSVFKYIKPFRNGEIQIGVQFPRRVYGVDQSGMSLKDVGLHPKIIYMHFNLVDGFLNYSVYPLTACWAFGENPTVCNKD